MVKYTKVEEKVENRSERRVRVFLAVMFFIQTLLTVFPFIQGTIDEEGLDLRGISALKMIFLFKDGAYVLATLALILVLFPMVAFFFCILDTKSRVKFVISGLCSVVCAVIITFTMAGMISIGAILTLIINVITLFMTSQGFQATSARMQAQLKK